MLACLAFSDTQTKGEHPVLRILVVRIMGVCSLLSLCKHLHKHLFWACHHN